ncbi:MAG: hypothetical protein WCG48_02255 [Candidatus Berkelbacteria bacterium]
MSEQVATPAGVRLVVPQLAYRLEGVRINYDLTPKETVGLLSGSNSDIALWPEDKMGLWNDGKTGVVEDAVLPFLWPKQSFSTAQGRQQQAPIGYVLPVELASLALPENDPQRIRKEINALGIWALVALRQSDEELWRLGGHFRPFYLDLFPRFFWFSLGCSGDDWSVRSALVGAPQVP